MTNRYKNQNYEINKFLNVPNEIELANFGSSHGQLGFYYNHNNSVAFNFALSSQTPEYDLRLLKQYLNRFSDNAIVIFPISYFTPYLFQHEFDTEFNVRNQRYYKILEPKNIIDFDWLEWIKENISYLNGKNLRNLNAILRDDELLDELKYINGNFPLIQWENVNSQNHQDLEDSSIARWDYWAQYRANLDIFKSGTMNTNVVQTYIEIVTICKENNLNPVFITLPVTAELNAVVDSNFYPIFQKDIQQLLEILDNPTYYDFSHDDLFIYNTEYFIDTDHLSKNGAIEFTRIILEKLNFYKYDLSIKK